MQIGFCASEGGLSTPRKAAIGAAPAHFTKFAIIRKLPPEWRYRLGVRTEDSQSSNPGSIPGSATSYYPLKPVKSAGYVFAQKRLWRVVARKSAFAGTQNGTQRDVQHSRRSLAALEYFGYMLTRSELVAWLDVRRSRGDSFTAIGRDLGVSRQAVQQWRKGATQPSRMALVFASHLVHGSRDLEPGLPYRPRQWRKSGA